MVDQHSRASLRSHGRRARRALVGAARERAEVRLLQHLMSLLTVRRAANVGSGTVGLFVAHDGEPDLRAVVTWLRARGAAVALPVVSDDPGDFTMRFVPWFENEPLLAGRYGIAVPRPAPAVDPSVTLVSCVGFDARGNRIGRGAGYFDRFLANRDTAVVGVAFECQRIRAIAAEPHDVAMATVVTDLGVRHIDRPRAPRSRS